MGDAKWVRLTALAGLAFLVLVVVGSQVQGSTPALDDPSQQIFTFIRDNQRDLKLSAALFGAAMAAVLFWTWGLFGALRKAENGNCALAVVAVAGGVLASATMVVSSAVIAATALRIYDLGASGARFQYTLYRFTFAGTNWGLGVLIGATAIVALRTGLFARWFRIASVVLAVLTLFGGAAIAYASDAMQVIGGVTLVLDSVWILAISIRLWRTPEIAVS